MTGESFNHRFRRESLDLRVRLTPDFMTRTGFGMTPISQVEMGLNLVS
jgi:hypothetical protein